MKHPCETYTLFPTLLQHFESQALLRQKKIIISHSLSQKHTSGTLPKHSNSIFKQYQWWENIFTCAEYIFCIQGLKNSRKTLTSPTKNQQNAHMENNAFLTVVCAYFPEFVANMLHYHFGETYKLNTVKLLQRLQRY